MNHFYAYEFYWIFNYISKKKSKHKDIKFINKSHNFSAIIDGGQNGSVVSFVNGESSNAVLDGFTLTNGSGTVDLCIPGLNGSCTATAGGGILCYGSNPTLRNLTISQNQVVEILERANPYGGGIGLINSDATLENIILFENNSTGGCSGILVSSGSNVNISNTQLSANTSSSDGTIDIHGSIAVFDNIIISNNLKISIKLYASIKIYYSEKN